MRHHTLQRLATPRLAAQRWAACASGPGGSGSSRATAHAQPLQQRQLALQMEQPPPDDDWLQRSRLLVGADGCERLASLNVLLVGLGGVGSFAAEFLVRAGVGALTIVDGDTVDTTNRNRQLPALRSTLGRPKAAVVAARLTDINPQLRLTVQQEFLDPVRAAALVQQQAYGWVVDCIDSVAPKQALLLAGHGAGVPCISSMGAGGRLDPARVRLADISETYGDAFAAVVRRGLRKAGVARGITVVFSDEPARPASLALTDQQYKKSYYGTCSYIPGLFGLYIASHIIRRAVEPDAYKLARLQRPGERRHSSAGAGAGAGASVGSKRKRSSPGHSRSSVGGGSGSGSGSGTDGGAQSAPPRWQPPRPQSTEGTLFRSFDGSQGVGMGWDGDGL